MGEEAKPFNKILLYALICLMVTTGSINTIVNKILQKLKGLKLLFEGHHWIITYGMFCGELVSIFAYIYIVIKRKQQQSIINQEQEGDTKNESLQEKKEGEKPPVPTNLIFAISAFCDLCASTLNTFGLTYLTSSMYQMMRGVELFFVCLWSKVFLKNPIYRHHILGVGSLIFGLSLVGLNAIMHDDKNVAKDPVIGIILLCSSQFFSSTVYVIQEKFIKKYEIHPFQLVGFEGLWGVIMYTALITIFQFISCKKWSKSLKEGICSENDKGEFHIEDSIFAFRQMGDNLAILFVYISYIVSIAVYNIVGINLTKLVSATARAVVDTVRTVFIWAFFLVCEPVDGTKEHFHILQFIGFIFLVCGTLIYNEILVIPIWALDYYTRDNIAKRKSEEKNVSMVATDEEKRLYLSVDGKDSNANMQEPPNALETNEDTGQN